MVITILGGKSAVSLRLPDKQALLSLSQTRKCERADLRGGVVYDAVVGDHMGTAELWWKPNFGKCYAVEVKDAATES